MSEVRHAAGVVAARAAPGGFEALVVRRSLALPHLPGFHTFVTGRVEPADAQAPLDGSFDDAAARAAALRELFEEAGILVADGGAVVPGGRERLRAELGREAPRFWRSLRARGLTAAASLLVPCGDWLTPGYTRTRFRARYYLLPLPAGTAAQPDPTELAAAEWLTPAAALAAHAQGRLALTFVTLEILHLLAAVDPNTVPARLEAGAWPHPGGEMLDGVHLLALRSPTLPPSTHTNTYVLGGEDLAVVDPAPDDEGERRALLAYLERLEGQGGRLRAVWLTHHHRDHVGAAAWLREIRKVPVCAHAAAAEALGPALHVDRLIADGETLPLAVRPGRRASWRALHLPGHCPGHLAFHDADRGALVAGDLVAGVGTIVIAPPEGDMAAYMTSLARLAALPLGYLFPGHGPPTGAPQAKLHAYVEHRRGRERAILAALAGGVELTAADLVSRVYADVAPAAWALAAQNVAAHLDKLAHEGRVEAADGAWRRR